MLLLQSKKKIIPRFIRIIIGHWLLCDFGFDGFFQGISSRFLWRRQGVKAKTDESAARWGMN